jgi:hypothetical protein
MVYLVPMGNIFQRARNNKNEFANKYRATGGEKHVEWC